MPNVGFRSVTSSLAFLWVFSVFAASSPAELDGCSADESADVPAATMRCCAAPKPVDQVAVSASDTASCPMDASAESCCCTPTPRPGIPRLIVSDASIDVRAKPCGPVSDAIAAAFSAPAVTTSRTKRTRHHNQHTGLTPVYIGRAHKDGYLNAPIGVTVSVIKPTVPLPLALSSLRF